MKHAFLLLVAAVVFSVLAPIALGKGASEATISGPGLDPPVVLTDVGRPSGEQLMVLTGFFPAVFEQAPDPMRDTRPAGELGPEYVVEYAMSGPNPETDTIVQKLYPYASAGPISYVDPGQQFWTTEETRGGWYVPGATLEDLLVAAGLPETAPADGDAADSPWMVLAPVLVLGAVAVPGGLAIVVIRRRPQPA
jgi:hypothetical protein